MYNNFIALVEEDNAYIPCIAGGRIYLKPSEVKEVIKGLNEYCNTHTDKEIELLNEQKRLEMFNCHSTKKEEKQTKKYGYVYMLSCEDKYKIGYSKDVERRIKQLDTKPFPLKLVFKVYSNNAYDIEHKLHSALEEYKVDGEWYGKGIEGFDMLDFIKEIAEELECDIQF